ncbi:MAG: hypothetical protein Q8P18_07110 [Pseudomonadota bacterium]|nr:hypothetical protein [Pseudomonadota bacterium]
MSEAPSSRLLDGELDGFDLRAELPRLLATVKGAGDRPLQPLFAALAAKDPVALAEVVCGSRAPGGASVVRAALPHVGVLEAALSPRGLYPRLLDLGGEAAAEVLALAAARHPAASWLVPLSKKAETFAVGLTHLMAAAAHPSFAAVCRAHADAGHVDGLVFVAAETGRSEPAAALLGVDVGAALRAAGAALDHDPTTPMLAHLAAAWGAEPDALIMRLIPGLRSRAAAEALLASSRHLPRTASTLRAVLRGMV